MFEDDNKHRTIYYNNVGALQDVPYKNELLKKLREKKVFKAAFTQFSRAESLGLYLNSIAISCDPEEEGAIRLFPSTYVKKIELENYYIFSNSNDPYGNAWYSSKVGFEAYCFKIHLVVAKSIVRELLQEVKDCCQNCGNPSDENKYLCGTCRANGIY